MEEVEAGGPVTLAVASRVDAGTARRAARQMAVRQGLGVEDAEAVTLAASELATNLAKYARGGELTITPLWDEGSGRRGVRLESRDRGPGIVDTDRAMRDGYSTGGGLGGGLGGVRRLMDEFTIVSEAGGTYVVAVKWA